MKRSIIDYLVISLKGMAMGAADVVPGVSGGTIAFISGIYEELIESLNNINSSIFNELKSKGVKYTWKKLNGPFLLALMSGVLISIFSLAKGVEWLLEHHPILLWAFFFGLVSASIVYVSKQIKTTLWDLTGLKVFLAITIGGSFAYVVSILNPIETSDSNLFLFFAGALAITFRTLDVPEWLPQAASSRVLPSFVGHSHRWGLGGLDQVFPRGGAKRCSKVRTGCGGLGKFGGQ